jgi:hypothetical protein
MGGLVARYYVEVLGGWENSRALITFGAPHRGSPNALDYLANGFRKMGWRFSALTETMQTFSSLYELLPRYEMLEVAGELRRPGEVDGIECVDADRARQALEFHRAIESEVKTNATEKRYQDGFGLLPYVGTGQTTLQSAKLENGRVRMSDRLPRGFDPLYADGDGTVPTVSAVPIEMSDRWNHVNSLHERHGALLRPDVLDGHLLDHLKGMQARGLSSIRGHAMSESRGLALSVDPLYEFGEPVGLDVNTIALEEQPRRVLITLQHEERVPEVHELSCEGERWKGRLEGLTTGLYRVEARALETRDLPPTVHGMFEVV